MGNRTRQPGPLAHGTNDATLREEGSWSIGDRTFKQVLVSAMPECRDCGRRDGNAGLTLLRTAAEYVPRADCWRPSRVHCGIKQENYARSENPRCGTRMTVCLVHLAAGQAHQRHARDRPGQRRRYEQQRRRNQERMIERYCRCFGIDHPGNHLQSLCR